MADLAKDVKDGARVIEEMTVALSQAKDELVRAVCTLELTEREAADTLAKVAMLHSRPSKSMLKYAAAIGGMAGVMAFLVLIALLTLTRFLST